MGRLSLPTPHRPRSKTTLPSGLPAGGKFVFSRHPNPPLRRLGGAFTPASAAPKNSPAAVRRLRGGVFGLRPSAAYATACGGRGRIAVGIFEGSFGSSGKICPGSSQITLPDDQSENRSEPGYDSTGPVFGRIVLAAVQAAMLGPFKER